MRQALVFRNGELAGKLIETDRNNYIFRYEGQYYADLTKASISLTLPKTKQEYQSNYLFPFFYNMLSEGVNKKLQCQQLKIDEEDYFGHLILTAQFDTIGAITVKPLE
jgi:serine/threonine-protein kinase HipA